MLCACDMYMHVHGAAADARCVHVRWMLICDATCFHVL